MTSNAPTVSFLRTMWEETQATKRIAFEGDESWRHRFSCNMPLGLAEGHICRTNDQQVGHGAQLRQDLHLVFVWKNGMACDIWQGICIIYLAWNSHSPRKFMLGRLLSFWEGLFSGAIRAILVSGRVPLEYQHLLDPGHWLMSWSILSKIDGVVRSNVENREPGKFLLVEHASCRTYISRPISSELF